VNLRGLFRRPNPELGQQHVAADLVLLDRLVPLAILRKEPDDEAMDLLADGVELKDAFASGDASRSFAAHREMPHEVFQTGEIERAQALTFGWTQS
jgi:hypothetical protein